jgi:hypothetical protein
MTSRNKLTPAEQSARFREAAKKAGDDQKSFGKAFKKIEPVRKKEKT